MGRPHRTSRDQRRRTHQQNFIIDPGIVERLVADVVAGDLVVDLGAGSGALTVACAAAGAAVIAVERDDHWCAHLRTRVRNAGLSENVRVVQGDLRTVDLPRGQWRVVANPPFGLTTALLHRLFDDPRHAPDRADLVLQWEVARKVAATPPRTLLGASWAPWWDLRLVQRIPRTAFRPAPRVDAGWLRARRRDPGILAADLGPAWASFLRTQWPPSGRPPR